MAHSHGGSIIGELLAAHGVRCLYTLCGGHISPILQGAKNHGVRIVDVRDERSAAFAADAASRMTGVPGVCTVTAGPGVTNTMTAVKNAQMAQQPMIIFGGATATVLRGRGSLQDIDQMALMEPVTKWCARITKVANIVPMVKKAFRVANEGVPGPVFLEVPVDILYPEEIVEEWFLKESGVDVMTGAVGKAGHLLRQPAVVAYFQGYVATEGQDKAPGEVIGQLEVTLKTLRGISEKPKLEPADVKTVQKTTSAVLDLL